VCSFACVHGDDFKVLLWPAACSGVVCVVFVCVAGFCALFVHFLCTTSAAQVCDCDCDCGCGCDCFLLLGHVVCKTQKIVFGCACVCGCAWLVWLCVCVMFFVSILLLSLLCWRNRPRRHRVAGLEHGTSV
jgi:hypothetical protein